MTVARLRRITVISAVVGIVLLMPFALIQQVSASDTSGLWVVATFAGICAVVVALNGLAWSAIFPRLPKLDPRRFTVTGVIVGLFCLVSIAAVIALCSVAIFTYWMWH